MGDIPMGGMGMLRKLKDLTSYSVLTADGAIGDVFSFYFDQQGWTIRYMIIDSEDQLGRRLLVSPQTVTEIDDEEMTITISLDRELLKNSPDLGLEQPPTPEEEAELVSYFQWPMYWAVDDDSLGTGNMAALPMIELAEDIEDQLAEQDTMHGPRLRSSREVRGYELHARDGDAGRLEDFIIEDENWSILYLIVDPPGLSNKRVLVSPSWIDLVSWQDQEIKIDLEKDTILHSPAIDPDTRIDRDFETRLYDHYGKNRYWEETTGG